MERPWRLDSWMGGRYICLFSETLEQEKQQWERKLNRELPRLQGLLNFQLDYHLEVYKVGIIMGEVSQKAVWDGREVER